MLGRVTQLTLSLMEESRMGVDPEHARELALGLPAVSEAPHWHRLAFRTPRKIFATLDATARDLNLMFTPDLRDFYCEQAPHAFSRVPGGWGCRGATLAAAARHPACLAQPSNKVVGAKRLPC